MQKKKITEGLTTKYMYVKISQARKVGHIDLVLLKSNMILISFYPGAILPNSTKTGKKNEYFSKRDVYKLYWVCNFVSYQQP